MKTVALIINISLAILGGLGSISPGRLFFLAREFEHRIGILVAASLRLLLGASLFSAAPTSRLPKTLRSFGLVSLATGIASPLIGIDGFSKIIKWWYALGPSSIRVWAISILGFGSLMTWALASSRRSDAEPS